MQDKVFSNQKVGIGSAIETNKVLRNTYLLLSMTLMFSAVSAGVCMAMNIGHGTSLIMSLAALGLLFFALPHTQNSSNIWVVFAFTGLIGGSQDNANRTSYGEWCTTDFASARRYCTGVWLIRLTAHHKKDFSFMGGLMIGLLVAIVGSIANIFLQIPAMSLAISAGIVLVMSGLILFDTSRIINGGETNYIRATVSLYLNIVNLFTSMLHLLGAMDD